MEGPDTQAGQAQEMDAAHTADTGDGDPLAPQGSLLGFGHPADVAGKSLVVAKETFRHGMCFRQAGSGYDTTVRQARPVAAGPVQTGIAMKGSSHVHGSGNLGDAAYGQLDRRQQRKLHPPAFKVCPSQVVDVQCRNV